MLILGDEWALTCASDREVLQFSAASHQTHREVLRFRLKIDAQRVDLRLTRAETRVSLEQVSA